MDKLGKIVKQNTAAVRVLYPGGGRFYGGIRLLAVYNNQSERGYQMDCLRIQDAYHFCALLAVRQGY